MRHSNLTELLHQADRTIVQEAVAHLQEKFAFRNAEFLKLKSEKEKTGQQYQNLTRTHQELLREYEHLHISADKSNKELSELKKEIRKKDQLLEEKQRQSEQTQKELYEIGRLLQESRQKEEYLLTEINSFKEKQKNERECFGREIGRDGRFIAYDNGTVVDVETKLMWAAKDNCEDIGWYQARDFCNSCKLGDYNDWRMPNINELKILRDSSKENSYGFYITNLIRLTGYYIWSSDITPTSKKYLCVDFYNVHQREFQEDSDSTFHQRVLPVRSFKLVYLSR